MEDIIENAVNNTEKENFDHIKVNQANIKVIGVGGAGNNMVTWLYKKGVKGAEIVACNTDQQHLDVSEADRKFLIGREATRGLGCGGYPSKGTEAAQESMQELKDTLKSSDMVFVCAGMGGGTGTGAAPVVASVARDTDAIVIGTVLTTINHVDVFLEGKSPNFLKIILNYCTPYCVTTWGAILGKKSQWLADHYSD